MRKISVAIIDPVGSAAGLDIYDESLSAALREQGLEAFVYSDFYSKDQKEFTFSLFGGLAKMKLLRAFFLPLAYLRSLKSAAKKNCGYIILHVFHFNAVDEWFLKQIRKKGLKALIIVHDVQSFVRRTDSIRLKRICEELAEKIIVHNVYTEKELKKIVSLTAIKKIHVIPHGHFLNAIAGTMTKWDAKQRLGLDPDKKMVLFFGMIKANKGLETLLKAWKGIDEKLSLLIAGRLRNISFAPFDEMIRNDLKGKNIRTRIRRISNEERDLMFRAADIVVLPYTKVYQSGVLLMAMSYSVPVIASKLEPFQELIEDKKNGMLFSAGNHEELGNAIRQLASDEALRARLTENAMSSLISNHDWRKIGLAYKEILQ